MKIKPCAYCWSDKLVLESLRDGALWYVTCLNDNCCAMGGSFPTKQEAIRKWNEITDCMKCRLSPHSEEYARACKVEVTRSDRACKEGKDDELYGNFGGEHD